VGRYQFDALSARFGANQRAADHHGHVPLSAQVFQRLHQRFGLDNAGVGRPDGGDGANVGFA